MMPRSLLTVVLASLSGATAAEVCYGPSRNATTVLPPTNATVFSCPSTGQGTIAQFAQSGWRIVKLGSLVVSGSAGGAQVADQLLIEKGRSVFENGFDAVDGA